jgi:hypothetical protein
LSGFRKTSKRLVFFRLFTFATADKVEILLYFFLLIVAFIATVTFGVIGDTWILLEILIS